MKFAYLILILNLWPDENTSAIKNVLHKDDFSDTDLISIATGISRNYSLLRKIKPNRPNYTPFNRIVGGNTTDISRFPSVACIILKHLDQDDFRGGAVIIRERWILTAAHCMEYISSKMIKKGRAFVRSNSDSWNEGYTDHLILASYTHENYNDYLTDFDIALVRVSEPFVGKFEKPVKIVNTNYKYTEGTTASVLGWGTTDPKPNEPYAVDRLRYTDVKIVNFRTCKADYKLINETVTERMICAAAPGKDACLYDSGGPLYQNKNLIGIVSWGGTTCAEINMPGVYTKLSVFYDWIKRKIKSKSKISGPPK